MHDEIRYTNSQNNDSCKMQSLPPSQKHTLRKQFWIQNHLDNTQSKIVIFPNPRSLFGKTKEQRKENPKFG